MSPGNIAAEAQKKKLSLVAICDHNSAENAAAVSKVAESRGVVILPGLEICTSEEIHFLAIFENMEAAAQMQMLVFAHLSGVNTPEVFGLQVVANECDEVERFQEKLLIGATDLDLNEAVSYAHKLGGLAVASHIDKESNSVFSQLGFIPRGIGFDALELTKYCGSSEARARFSLPEDVPIVRNSDAHMLADVGMNTCEYVLEQPSFSELRLALRHEDGRTIECA